MEIWSDNARQHQLDGFAHEPLGPFNDGKGNKSTMSGEPSQEIYLGKYVRQQTKNTALH